MPIQFEEKKEIIQGQKDLVTETIGQDLKAEVKERMILKEQKELRRAHKNESKIFKKGRSKEQIQGT